MELDLTVCHHLVPFGTRVQKVFVKELSMPFDERKEVLKKHFVVVSVLLCITGDVLQILSLRQRLERKVRNVFTISKDVPDDLLVFLLSVRKVEDLCLLEDILPKRLLAFN